MTRSESARPTINPSVITATTIIGDKIKDNNGKQVGKIHEVVMDLTRNSVRYVVMSSGGFLGIGDKFIAIPLKALTLDLTNKSFRINADGKQIRKLRGFNKERWPEQAKWPPV